MLILSRLEYHEEHKLELKNKQLAESKVVADAAKKDAAKNEKRAAMVQEALEVQIATENERVEERAQELAAAKLQAVMRGKQDRKLAIEACIVRVMKARNQLTHQQLVMEVSQSLSSIFKPDARIIKKRIEDLIQRDYLERDEGSGAAGYKYKA